MLVDQAKRPEMQREWKNFHYDGRCSPDPPVW